MTLETGHINQLNDMHAKEHATPTVTFPPQNGWWTASRVTYLRDLFQMLFFGLAFPYLIMRFFKDPFGTIKVIGRAQVSAPA